MAFYKISEMQAKKSNVGPAVGKSVAGELIKVGVTTYQEGEGPRRTFIRTKSSSCWSSKERCA